MSIRYLNSKETTVLNFSWNYTDLSALSSPYTIYAASTEGIYRIVNSEEIIYRFRKMLNKLASYVGLPATTIFIVILAFIIYQTNTRHFIVPFLSFSTLPIIAVIITVYAVAVALIIFKNASSVNLLGELVVPWSEISKIDVTNVRQVRTSVSSGNRNTNGTSIEVGDWRVITYDGREILISNVDNPNLKLKDIKQRFGLNF